MRRLDIKCAIRGAAKPVFCFLCLLFFVGILHQDYRLLLLGVFGGMLCSIQNYVMAQGFSVVHMATGKPVACSNTSCLPEIVGEDAVLFDPENASAIATSMKQLLRGGESVEGLSVSGKRRSEKFDWKRSALKYLNMYRDIIHEK